MTSKKKKDSSQFFHLLFLDLLIFFVIFFFFPKNGVPSQYPKKFEIYGQGPKWKDGSLRRQVIRVV